MRTRSRRRTASTSSTPGPQISARRWAFPRQYKHGGKPGDYEVTAQAARSHEKSFGVDGVREDLEFQTWLMELGMRYLTGGSDVGYILSAGRADVKRIREVRLS